MRLLFLDIATDMGVAEGDPGDAPLLWTVTLGRPGDSFQTRMARATGWAIDKVMKAPPDICWLEAPVRAGGMTGATTAHTQAILQGYVAVIMGAFSYRRIPIEQVGVSKIRKFVIGKGNLKGDRAKAEVDRVCRAEGFRPRNLNESDAWAGWRWAAAKYKGRPAPRHLWVEPELKLDNEAREAPRRRRIAGGH